ncbi:MAG: hypothetical protein MK116_04140 [Phycisphaerales bacterium]|nr:hypothetical protein [Phycisphaerales bacterium]
MMILAAMSIWATAWLFQPADPTTTPPANTNGQAGEPAPDSTPDAPLPRVIVYPSRLHSIAGHLVEESPDRITVRSRTGETQTFDPSLIFSMIRLHDLDEPAPAIVLLQDGRRREGLLVVDGFDIVRLLIHDVPHEFKREDVALVKLLPSFQERYEQLRGRLNEEDVQAYLGFCQWLMDEGRLEEAEKDLEKLIQLHDSELGRRLLRRVQARLALKATRKTSPETSTPARGNDMPPLVSDEDVNLVRVYEIDLDNPPRLRVPVTTIRSLFDRYGNSTLLPDDAAGRAAFAKAEPVKIVEVMFALRARDLYGDIKVLTEPAVLQTFRTQVHDTWLLNKCGSKACHGGSSGGRFRLHSSRRPDDRVRTSNLLTLNRLELDGRRMLDWSSPEDSLTYQYALPRSEARWPHPDVKGFEPAFNPGGSPARRAWKKWVEAMNDRHHREWPVEYTPWAPPAKAAPDARDDAESAPVEDR